MFFFVSEPVSDPIGLGASFCVNLTTIHCASMSEAVAMSQRMRSALQALAGRGVRPRGGPGTGALPMSKVLAWIDELVLQGLAPDLPRPLPPRSRDEFEIPQ